jgi:hypothetical protein
MSMSRNPDSVLIAVDALADAVAAANHAVERDGAPPPGERNMSVDEAQEIARRCTPA